MSYFPILSLHNINSKFFLDQFHQCFLLAFCFILNFFTQLKFILVWEAKDSTLFPSQMVSQLSQYDLLNNLPGVWNNLYHILKFPIHICVCCWTLCPLISYFLCLIIATWQTLIVSTASYPASLLFFISPSQPFLPVKVFFLFGF